MKDSDKGLLALAVIAAYLYMSKKKERMRPGVNPGGYSIDPASKFMQSRGVRTSWSMGSG